MSDSQLLLLFVYVVVIILNYQRFTTNRITVLLTVITVVLSVFLLFSSNNADLDWNQTKLDMSGYRNIFEKYNAIEHHEVNMYFLFYRCMYLGQQAGITFRQWWAIMSILAMAVVFIACKIHRFSFNLFLATFMAYHEFAFYSGLKFLYGFCFLLLAYGFLMRNTHKGQLLFVLFIIIAAGFHVMYYFFLILLIKPLKRPRLFVNIIVFITVVFTLLMRLSESAVDYLEPFFDALDNEHIQGYSKLTVNFGFYIALSVHLVVVYAAYRIRKYLISAGRLSAAVDTLYYTILISLVFVPFYSAALTFMRLITAFSLVVITASSFLLSNTYKSRLLCRNMSLIVVFAFLFFAIVINTNGFFDNILMPYFNVF